MSKKSIYPTGKKNRRRRAAAARSTGLVGKGSARARSNYWKPRRSWLRAL